MENEQKRLARDGTAEAVSGGQISRRERGQGKLFIFPAQLTTSRIGIVTMGRRGKREKEYYCNNNCRATV